MCCLHSRYLLWAFGKLADRTVIYIYRTFAEDDDHFGTGQGRTTRLCVRQLVVRRGARPPFRTLPKLGGERPRALMSRLRVLRPS